MSKTNIWAVVAALAALAVPGLAAAVAYDPGTWNVPVGVTEISRKVFDLHMLIFWVCVVIAVVVFGAMFYSVFAHRRSAHPKPADFHESTTVEIAWTIVPFFILVAMAIPAAATLIKMDDTSGSELTVKVTGYQWKWHYDYVGENVSFFSTLSPESNRARQLDSGIDPNTVPNYLVDVDNPLVLPVGQKIRFLITSNDVIHAWWVAEFAVKKDAIPGYVNEIWTKIEQPGTYRGVCAELCGRDHGYMPIVVKAVPLPEYQAWLAQQKGVVQVAAGGPGATIPAMTDSPAATRSDVPATMTAPERTLTTAAAESAPAVTAGSPGTGGKGMTQDELMALGKKVYDTNCAACHQAAGTGLPPNFPALKGGKVTTGPAPEHIRQVLHGKGMMTPFKHLSDAEIAAVVTFERKSWGNDASVVQPADVTGLR